MLPLPKNFIKEVKAQCYDSISVTSSLQTSIIIASFKMYISNLAMKHQFFLWDLIFNHNITLFQPCNKVAAMSEGCYSLNCYHLAILSQGCYNFRTSIRVVIFLNNYQSYVDNNINGLYIW